jgi:hypothetical protein
MGADQSSLPPLSDPIRNRRRAPEAILDRTNRLTVPRQDSYSLGITKRTNLCKRPL